MPPDGMSAVQMVLLLLCVVFCAVCMLFVYALNHVSFARLRKASGKKGIGAKHFLLSEERHGFYLASAVWWMVVSTCAIVLILCKATVLPWQLFANTSLNPVWASGFR